MSDDEQSATIPHLKLMRRIGTVIGLLLLEWLWLSSEKFDRQALVALVTAIGGWIYFEVKDYSENRRTIATEHGPDFRSASPSDIELAKKFLEVLTHRFISEQKTARYGRPCLYSRAMEIAAIKNFDGVHFEFSDPLLEKKRKEFIKAAEQFSDALQSGSVTIYERHEEFPVEADTHNWLLRTNERYFIYDENQTLILRVARYLFITETEALVRAIRNKLPEALIKFVDPYTTS